MMRTDALIGMFLGLDSDNGDHRVTGPFGPLEMVKKMRPPAEATSSARDDALSTKADFWDVDIRTRRRDDQLVGCAGLDRLPVDQVPGVLKSAPHKLSAHLGLIRFHYCQRAEKRSL